MTGNCEKKNNAVWTKKCCLPSQSTHVAATKLSATAAPFPSSKHPEYWPSLGQISKEQIQWAQTSAPSHTQRRTKITDLRCLCVCGYVCVCEITTLLIFDYICFVFFQWKFLYILAPPLSLWNSSSEMRSCVPGCSPQQVS